jgi:hypothetical protein
VAPFDEGVVLVLEIDWDEPLKLWANTSVFDYGDPTTAHSGPFHSRICAVARAMGRAAGRSGDLRPEAIRFAPTSSTNRVRFG